MATYLNVYETVTEYAELKKLREGAAVIQAIIIEGIHLGSGKSANV